MYAVMKVVDTYGHNGREITESVRVSFVDCFMTKAKAEECAAALRGKILKESDVTVSYVALKAGDDKKPIGRTYQYSPM